MDVDAPASPPSDMDRLPSVSADAYYSEYHGHLTPHLNRVHDALRRHGANTRIVFTAGDSSLDNKYWFGHSAPAVANGYHRVLSPPVMKQDVTYWLNRRAADREGLAHISAINTAVEATTLNGRACCKLLKQDKFLKNHVRQNDVVIVSVGGNDIALMPCLCTIVNIGLISCCTPHSCVEATKGVPFPCDDCCCGCGFGCLSTLTACPAPCMGYFYHMFQTRVQAYVNNLTSGEERPGTIIVCMIYYLDEAATGSWADGMLGCLGYNSNPKKLQMMIRRVFEEAVSKIKVDGAEVIPFPLFKVLDGKTSSDYRERVEPSPEGGRKIADALLDVIEGGEAAKRWIGADAAGDEKKII